MEDNKKTGREMSATNTLQKHLSQNFNVVDVAYTLFSIELEGRFYCITVEEVRRDENDN